MDNHLPLSVLMPVYNCEAFIDAAIMSIRDQTFSDFEFVIVNDGSTDNSLGIAEKHAREDHRIILLDRPNGGIVAALNSGLEVCKGEFIARMDGDDISCLDRFQKQLYFLHNHPHVAMVGGQIRTFSTMDSLRAISGYPLDHEAIVLETLHVGAGMIHPTWMARRAAFEAVGPYDDRVRYCEDADMLLRMSDRFQLANMDECVLMYRRHPGAVGISRRAWQARSRFLVVSQALKRRGISDRGLLSKMAYRASWTSRAEGYTGEAIRWGLRSWCYSPLSIRSLWTTLRSALSFVSN